MTLRFIDSFDHYASADISLKWNGTSGSTSAPIISAGTGRRGGASMRINANFQYGYASKTIDAQSTWTIGAALRWSFVGGGPASVFTFTDSGYAQVGLLLTSAGNFIVVNGAGTILGTSTASININTYYFIEFKALINGSTGTVDVRVNGTNILSLTGQNTQYTLDATANQFIVGTYGEFFNNTSAFDVDDLYICDGNGSVNNTFLGDCRVDAFLPTGNGSNSSFTNDNGNSINNYSYVNEASQDGDTTFVADATIGNRDTYAITGITFSPASIFGLQTNLIARCDDAGFRSITPVIYRSSTPHDGISVALGTDYIDFTQIYEQDPATAATWTKTNINASEYGIKVAS